jgi:outer membrane beta-barrel protein
MEGRIFIFLLKPAVLLLCLLVMSGCGRKMLQDNSADAAVPVVNPEVARRDVREPKIDKENFEVGAYFGLKSVEDFESNTVWGLRGAYHMTESFFVEGTYGQTTVGETSFEKLSGGAPLLSDEDREYSYYDVSIGYNILPGEAFIGSSWAVNSALYLTAGAGSTTFAGDDFFTLVLGAGYRVLATDWLAMHFNVRDHIFDTDLLGEEKTTHNIEFNFGLTFFF